MVTTKAKPASNGRAKTAKARVASRTETRGKVRNGRREFEIELDDPNLSAQGTLTLKVVGTASLIQHRFGEKARKMMLDAQMGRAKGKKAPKNPEADFLEALHVIGKRPKSMDDLHGVTYGMPAVCFKQAAVRGAYMNGVPMTEARCLIHVLPEDETTELVRLDCSTPEMRMDHVRIQRTADIRVRPEFAEWSVTLRVQFNARLTTAEQVVAWFNQAGMNGVGEWRPFGKESTGIHGTFRVVEATAEIPEIAG